MTASPYACVPLFSPSFVLFVLPRVLDSRVIVFSCAIYIFLMSRHLNVAGPSLSVREPSPSTPLLTTAARSGAEGRSRRQMLGTWTGLRSATAPLAFIAQECGDGRGQWRLHRRAPPPPPYENPFACFWASLPLLRQAQQ